MENGHILIDESLMLSAVLGLPVTVRWHDGDQWAFLASDPYPPRPVKGATMRRGPKWHRSVRRHHD